MKNTYKVSGMSCSGCRAHVEELLQKTEGVKNADVSLKKEEAVIEADQDLSLDELQAVFAKDGGHYTISK